MVAINSGVTAGGRGRVPPDSSYREISVDLPGKGREGKKGKRRRKEGKSTKGRSKIENGRGESYKMRRGHFFFFFCFSLFKTTEICFESTKLGIFYREKAFQAGKKLRRITFLPSLKNIPFMPLDIKQYWNVLDLENIPELGNTRTIQMLQYCPILDHSTIAQN